MKKQLRLLEKKKTYCNQNRMVLSCSGKCLTTCLPAYCEGAKPDHLRALIDAKPRTLSVGKEGISLFTAILYEMGLFRARVIECFIRFSCGNYVK